MITNIPIIPEMHNANYVLIILTKYNTPMDICHVILLDSIPSPSMIRHEYGNYGNYTISVYNQLANYYVP